jgi:hypothetical protein
MVAGVVGSAIAPQLVKRIVPFRDADPVIDYRA